VGAKPRREPPRERLAMCRYCQVPLEIVKLDQDLPASPLVSQCPKCRRLWGRIADD